MTTPVIAYLFSAQTSDTPLTSYLTSPEETALELVDDRVSIAGHLSVLVPSKRAEEVSRVGQTIGTCKRCIAIIVHTVQPCQVCERGKATAVS